MNEYDKNDDLDNQDVVRHPWGTSRPWTVKGYTPQRWLAGAPRRQPWPAQVPFGAVPQGLNLPSMPQTITQTSTNLAAPTELVKEKTDKWRVVHVTAFVLLAVSSFGSMLLSYRMFLDRKKVIEKEKLLTSEPTPVRNLTYQYAKRKLLNGEYPSTSIVYQLNEYWIEDEDFHLLDGPFKSRSLANTHVSRALDKAQKFVGR